MSNVIIRSKLLKGIGSIALIAFLIYFLLNSTTLIHKSTDTFMVENGTLSYEEETEGYIIRDETILKGNNYSNGLSQIVTEGTRVSKDESVFRYYSNKEEEINKQINELDKQIDEAMKNNSEILDTFFSTDITNLENEIKESLNNIDGENSISTINEYTKKINSYIIKKSEIAGEYSPAGSYIKTLFEQRNELNKELTTNSENITAPFAGVISYRVDGLEEVLGYNNQDFGYLSSELLNGFELNVGTAIPESKESGKIVNNYECYIACPMNTENSEVAEVGDKVYLRLPNSNTVRAEIVRINEEGNSRVIIFKITDCVEELIEYRKISLDIVWWSYSGWKVSNSALIERDDLTYIKRIKAGVEQEILVKVLRQNETFSIVENYSDEELLELGFSVDEIQNFNKIKLYDEIKIFKE